MKRLLKGTSILLVMAALGFWMTPVVLSALLPSSNDSDMIRRAYESRESNVWVEAPARVTRLLPDGEDLGHFQEFRVELENGHVLRVMHDLDRAQRVPFSAGSQIRIRGEYDWSPEGGVIHWTHIDQSGERDGGWILYEGRRYN
jgi:hypothetical protein